MIGDPLSEVVRALELSGGLFLDARLTAPWAILAQVSADDCRPFMEVPERVIAFHVVTRGRMLVLLDGRHVLRGRRRRDRAPAAQRGPHRGERAGARAGARRGRWRSRPPRAASCASSATAAAPRRASSAASSPAHGAPSPILETLPRLLGVRDRGRRGARLDRGLGPARGARARARRHRLRRGDLAAGRAAARRGASPLLARPASPVGLARRHARPAHRPGAGADARRPGAAVDGRGAGRRRSACRGPPSSTRFGRLVGVPPIRYLAQARLAAARALLRETGLTASEIAYRVGFEAPVAFNRAFKRAFGLPPAAWRDRERGGAAELSRSEVLAVVGLRRLLGEEPARIDDALGLVDQLVRRNLEGRGGVAAAVEAGVAGAGEQLQEVADLDRVAVGRELALEPVGLVGVVGVDLQRRGAARASAPAPPRARTGGRPSRPPRPRRRRR